LKLNFGNRKRGWDLRHALRAVDVARGKPNTLVGQQHAKDYDERVIDDDANCLHPKVLLDAARHKLVIYRLECTHQDSGP
jgi:hypothetical protein